MCVYVKMPKIIYICLYYTYGWFPTSHVYHSMSTGCDLCGKRAPWSSLPTFIFMWGNTTLSFASVFSHYNSDNHPFLVMYLFNLAPLLSKIPLPNLQNISRLPPRSQHHHLLLSSFPSFCLITGNGLHHGSKALEQG